VLLEELRGGAELEATLSLTATGHLRDRVDDATASSGDLVESALLRCLGNAPASTASETVRVCHAWPPRPAEGRGRAARPAGPAARGRTWRGHSGTPLDKQGRIGRDVPRGGIGSVFPRAPSRWRSGFLLPVTAGWPAPGRLLSRLRDLQHWPARGPAGRDWVGAGLFLPA